MQGSTTSNTAYRVGWSLRPTGWAGVLDAVGPVSTITSTGPRVLTPDEWGGGSWCEPVQWVAQSACGPTVSKPGPCDTPGGGTAVPFPVYQWTGCDMNIQSLDSELGRVASESLAGQVEVAVADEMWASAIANPANPTGFNPDLVRSATVIPGGPYNPREALRIGLRQWFGVVRPASGGIGSGHGWVPWLYAPAVLLPAFLSERLVERAGSGWNVGPIRSVFSPGLGVVAPDGDGGVAAETGDVSWLILSGPVEASTAVIADVQPSNMHRLNQRLWFYELAAIVRPMVCRTIAVPVTTGGC